MLGIYLCEDNKEQLEHWNKIVKKYILMSDREVVLQCVASNPNELLAERKTVKHVGIYFLDIDLQASMDGIELAQEIRKLDPRGYIVFITTHGEMNLLTFRYKIEAMDFILKDEPELLASRICDCIETAVVNHDRSLNGTHCALRIKNNGNSTTIDQNEIVYIKTADVPRKVTIHMTHGIRQASGSLKEFLILLNTSFIQCSRSTIINLNQVKEYQVKENLLIFNNDETVPVSIRMAGKLKKHLRGNAVPPIGLQLQIRT